LVQEAERAFGRIDVLVNNAGVSSRCLAVETDPSVEDKVCFGAKWLCFGVFFRVFGATLREMCGIPGGYGNTPLFFGKPSSRESYY
jgi:NAD(P)-dependent dehydrogenase (short-subunit alcohol dehydrogenase family)